MNLKAVRGGLLIDGTGGPPLEDSTILIEGPNIIAVGPKNKISVPSDAVIIDASDKTVMPGLMDMHVHLCSTVDLGTAGVPRGILMYNMLKTPPSLVVLYAARNARVSLEAGFTTLRDLGGYTVTTEIINLRKAIDLGLVSGPRIMTAGPWITPPAGHLDLAMTVKTYPPRTASGVDEVRRAVREAVQMGADLIKTSATGGVMGEGESIQWTNYTIEELKVIVEEAHAFGKKVAAHASGTQGIKNALIAGVDTIEHGMYMDDEGLKMMLDKKAFLIPTLAPMTVPKPSDVSEEVLRKSKESAEAHVRSFTKAHKAGVRIAMGTDTYMSLPYHGRNAVELELYVKYGMTPMEAIVATTKTCAEALGLEGRLGTLEKGKLADMIIVDGSPLKDIRVLQDKAKIRKVLKEGNVVVDKNDSDSGSSYKR